MSNGGRRICEGRTTWQLMLYLSLGVGRSFRRKGLVDPISGSSLHRGHLPEAFSNLVENFALGLSCLQVQVSFCCFIEGKRRIHSNCIRIMANRPMSDLDSAQPPTKQACTLDLFNTLTLEFAFSQPSKDFVCSPNEFIASHNVVQQFGTGHVGRLSN